MRITRSSERRKNRNTSLCRRGNCAVFPATQPQRSRSYRPPPDLYAMIPELYYRVSAAKGLLITSGLVVRVHRRRAHGGRGAVGKSGQP